MLIGQRVKTSMGELIILDIKENYIILLDQEGQKFIKGNNYNKDSSNKLYWSNGEYYSNLDNLIKGIEG